MWNVNKFVVLFNTFFFSVHLMASGYRQQIWGNWEWEQTGIKPETCYLLQTPLVSMLYPLKGLAVFIFYQIPPNSSCVDTAEFTDHTALMDGIVIN